MNKFWKVILILAIAALAAIVLAIYYWQIQNNDSDEFMVIEVPKENVLTTVAASQTPTFKKAIILGTVSINSQPAKGTVEISGKKYTLKDGKFTISNLNSGIYPVSYLDENNKEHKLTPPSIQVFPGENSSFEFNVNP